MADSFQKRFILAMQIRGIKQVDLINKTGISQSKISQYASGKHEPRQETLYKLATALDVNIAWLMGKDVPMDVNMSELKGEAMVCKLMEKCYGAEAYELVDIYINLNNIGKERLMLSAKDILQINKYTDKEP